MGFCGHCRQNGSVTRRKSTDKSNFNGNVKAEIESGGKLGIESTLADSEATFRYFLPHGLIDYFKRTKCNPTNRGGLFRDSLYNVFKIRMA